MPRHLISTGSPFEKSVGYSRVVADGRRQGAVAGRHQGGLALKSRQYVRFRTGIAKYPDLAMLVGYWGATDNFEPPTYIVVFDEKAAESSRWGGEERDFVFVDVCTFRGPGDQRPAFVALDENGQVWFHRAVETVEKIPDAGLFQAEPAQYGYLSRLRQIGDSLYATGFRGQVYRRETDGRWAHFDDGLLDPQNDNLDIVDICGAPDGSFIAVDHRGGRIFSRRDSGVWRDLPNPSRESLSTVTCAPDGTVWIAGANGTLLSGNAREGFTVRSTKLLKAAIISAVVHDGAILVCSPTALYRLGDQGLEQVDTGLSPQPRSFNRLQSIDGTLWSFGYDDIIRFGPAGWERLDSGITDPW